MCSQPRVSIITATYNSAQYLDDCVGSVISQNYPDWEMFVIDDCSPDNTQQAIQPYLLKHPNIHYHRMPQNTGGPAQPRNYALSKASGRYIAFLDGDDMFMPDKLNKQVAFMQEKNCAISYTGLKTLLPDGQKTGNYVSVPKSIDYPGYLKNTCIAFGSSMVDIQKTGPLHMDEKVPIGRDDTALWIKLLKEKHEAFGLNEDLMRFRRGHNSISSNVLQMAKANWEVYGQMATDLNIAQRAWYFMGYAANAMLKRLDFKSI